MVSLKNFLNNKTKELVKILNNNIKAVLILTGISTVFLVSLI